MRISQSDQFLREFSGEHLAMTVELFFGTAAELFRHEESISLNVKSALMDAFRIHARSLLYFLYTAKPLHDDSIAQDFMPGGQVWAGVRTDQTQLLQTLQKRVNKEVAHLTYTRPFFKHEDSGWNFGAIMADLWMALREFIHFADENKLHENVRESHERWLQVFLRDGVFSVDPSSCDFTMWTTASEN